MQKRIPHIVFSGGGTGGHLFPGLAVAERLAASVPHLRITFCGSGKPFERKQVEQAGFDYHALPARPLPQSTREAVEFVLNNLTSYLAAGRFLREEGVSAVVGLGGYASAPMARAAARRGIPLVLLEQNAVAGKTTRWLARRASLVCTSFDPTAGDLPSRCRVRWTGNPVRVGFVPRHHPAQEGKTDCRQVLVLGGSGGARALNENVPRALYKLPEQLRGWRIVHQTGESDYEATRDLYKKLGLDATVVSFVADMPGVLAETDLAICRAGGTTLAELAAVGVPAILLPYPHAADDHQAANARHYATAGGCVTIDQREADGRLDDRIAEMLCFLLANDDLLGRMARAMLEMAMPNAADDVAELVWSIVSSRAHHGRLTAAGIR